MAIAFDAASSSNTVTSQSSLTFSHTCTGSNLVLIVGVSADSAASPTSVTYNGVGMTKQVTETGIDTTLWTLANPSTGANNIVVTFAAGHYFSAGGISLTGCDTSSPVGATNHGNGSANDAAISVTTTQANSWLVACVTHNRNSSVTAISGSTVRYNEYNVTDNFRGIGLTAPTTTTGAYSIGETMGTASDGWWATAIEIKEPAGSTSPSISPSTSPSTSISPSRSPSISPSTSPSTSISPSRSPSVSPSRSPSISPSPSPISSTSPSLSPSISPSISASISPSRSPSISPSVSPSTSISPSRSPSISPSVSPSSSRSPSRSPSQSPSASISPSISPSASPSSSVSPSPSPGDWDNQAKNSASWVNGVRTNSTWYNSNKN